MKIPTELREFCGLPKYPCREALTKIAVLAVCVLVAAWAMGGEPLSSEKQPVMEPESFFDERFQLDLFGGYQWGPADEDAGGSGSGLAWYPGTWYGIGVHGVSTGSDFFSGSADILLRLPFEGARIAPYVSLGYGYADYEGGDGWGPAAGGGIDWRFSGKWGIFADWRYMRLDSGIPDRRLVRLGLRRLFD